MSLALGETAVSATPILQASKGIRVQRHAEEPNLIGGSGLSEYNGFQSAQPEVLKALSANGSASSMSWNVNDDNAFSCARGGELVASVDM
jgi:hypothetical protein